MGRLSAWAAHRGAPVGATVALVVTVMTYSLVGHSALHGGHIELKSPDDLWGLAASSWAIAHGEFAQTYVRHGTLTSPPALEFVLVPALLLGHTIGGLAQPLGVWVVLGPAALLLASTALFAVDAVARYWRLSEGARVALALVGGLAVANVAGLWGHPEDCIALAFVVWAALRVERLGSAAGPGAALLLGVGIAFQPLAVLGVAPVLSRLGWKAATRLWWRLVLPSLVVLVPPVLSEPGRTFFVLAHQPFLPRFVSFTPLTHLAPVLGPGVDGGGATRLIATVISACLAVAVCRRRHDLTTVLTMVAVAFMIRILLETELNWYYLWPVSALCLLLSLRRSAARFWLCSTALFVSMVLGDHDTERDIALWWPALMATLVVMVLSTGPSPRRWVELAVAARDSAGARAVGRGPMVQTLGAGRRDE